MGQFDLDVSFSTSAGAAGGGSTGAAGSSRLVSTDDVQRNPWGRANEDGGLNPHRTDLWYVDFSAVTAKLRTDHDAETQELVPAISQLPAYYVRSINLPGAVVRAETFRRASIPFQMPSWDEPLEPLNMTFLMESVAPNPVLELLSAWQARARAGRGGLGSLGWDKGDWRLNDRYGIDFSFVFQVWLLQGSIAPVALAAQVESDAFTEALAYQQAQRAQQDIWRTASGLRNSKGPLAQSNVQDSVEARKIAQLSRRKMETIIGWSQCERILAFDIKAWLSSYKVGDLNYNAAELLLAEARFYPEYIRPSIP